MARGERMKYYRVINHSLTNIFPCEVVKISGALGDLGKSTQIFPRTADEVLSCRQDVCCVLDMSTR